jgi:trehalose 6-phosphate phosphatase
MAQPITSAITNATVKNYAWLFDLDGTLAPIVERPCAVRVLPAALQVLPQLHEATQGAVAIVSGRSLRQIDQLLSPHVFYAAGLHGAQWRDSDGKVTQLSVNTESVAAMAQALSARIAPYTGVQLEEKDGLSLALHYRLAPTFMQAVHQVAESVLGPYEEYFTLQPGKMVLEIKPKGASKGAAIQRLMQGAPFNGRIPVFAGDDVTDEAGFLIVNQLGGISIKIGEGETCANSHMLSPAVLTSWLASLCPAG